jgi:signal transduction histidine kinase
MNATSSLLVRRLSRGQLIVFDCLIGWGFCLAFLSSSAQATAPAAVRITFAFGLGLPLAVRRLWPRTVSSAVLGLSVVATIWPVVPMPLLAPAWALYVVALRERGCWRPPTSLIAGLTGFVLAWLLVVPVRSADGLSETLLGLAAVGGAWTVGRAVAERRSHHARSAERLAAESVNEERLRIARELHDVVAHSMGVIAVKAGVANHVMRTRPQEAGNALRAIEVESRSALAEMRRMLGVLRTEPADLAPLPGVEGLPALAERAGLAGVDVDLRVRGAGQLPQGLGLMVYRIAQESITNVIKHAAPTGCRITVDCDGRRVTIEVVDGGPGRGTIPTKGAGHGLLGMRERVTMYGGVFESGPRPGGGFRIFAHVPYEEVP